MTYNVFGGTLNLAQPNLILPDAIGMKNWHHNLASNFWHRFLERVYEALVQYKIILHCDRR